VKGHPIPSESTGGGFGGRFRCWMVGRSYLAFCFSKFLERRLKWQEVVDRPDWCIRLRGEPENVSIRHLNKLFQETIWWWVKVETILASFTCLRKLASPPVLHQSPWLALLVTVINCTERRVYTRSRKFRERSTIGWHDQSSSWFDQVLVVGRWLDLSEGNFATTDRKSVV